MNTRTPPSSHTHAIPDPPAPAPEKPLKVSARSPVGEVYIDRGQPLPDRYPGLRLQAMVRDPGTIFVYWEPPDDLACDGWVVVARDAEDQTLNTLRVPFDVRQGYLHVAALEVVTISLYPAEGTDADGAALMSARLDDLAASPIIVVQAPTADWTGAWSNAMDRWAVLRPPLPDPGDEPPLVVSVEPPLEASAEWDDPAQPAGASRPWSGTLSQRRGDR
jgi:hypothetical protein